jgi:endogenous inhibitor of DNA gyrase (YacG/DUF329 family)
VTDQNPPSRIVKCPTCGKAVAWSRDNRWRPFCSERCRLIDLGEWASETHRIAGATPADFEGNAGEAPNENEDGGARQPGH